MNLTDINGCAVPQAIASQVKAVVAKVGVGPTSVYRGSEAAAILNAHGKHTQEQLFNANSSQRAAWGVMGTPDRPGTSTHECRSDGVAYAGPAGRKLADWQCGMDWPDNSIPSVMTAFRAIGCVPIHPYISGVEYHHINLAKAPKILWAFLPLKQGSKGLWVYVLTGRLKNCGYHSDGKGKGPLLTRGGKFDLRVHNAVRRFQADHHLPVDGVVGPQTWANLKAAERAAKKVKK